jgi:cadmium resistance protein CadD (predicted permease)
MFFPLFLHYKIDTLIIVLLFKSHTSITQSYNLFHGYLNGFFEISRSCVFVAFVGVASSIGLWYFGLGGGGDSSN